MKKIIFTMASFSVFCSFSFGNTIQLNAYGASEYHTGLIQDDLLFLQNSAVSFLSNQIKCDSIDIKFQIKEGSFFQDNEYLIQGTAKCPGVVTGEMEVQIDSGGAGSNMTLKLQTESQHVITKTFRAASRGE